MKLRKRISGIALVFSLALTGALAACGSDDKDDTKSDDSSSQSDEKSTDEDSDDTSTDDTEDDSTEEDSTEEDSSSDEASGDKPSKDDVIAGYTTFINDTAGGQLPESMIGDLVTCIIDDIYDDISTESAQAIADANATGMSPEDAQALATATGTCTQNLGQ